MTRDRQSERRPVYRRNERLEKLLSRLNRVISGRVRDESEPESPVLFLVGCPRSGATLLLQWLARSGTFAYPSNFIARFWSHPRVGALVQEMLTQPEYDFRGELADVRLGEIDFSSDLGKTAGFLAPNEFWYFWRRYFPFGETHHLTADQLERLDVTGLGADLQALAAVSGKPLALKAHLVGWHVGFLARSFSWARFLYLDRDPFFLMQSLLEARRRFYGTESRWYSLRPPEYPALTGLPPVEQVAGQVWSVRTALARQLEALPAERWARVGYDELCARPGAVAERIEGLFGRESPRLDQELAAGFESADTVRLDPEKAERLRAAYRRFEAEGSPRP